MPARRLTDGGGRKTSASQATPRKPAEAGRVGRSMLKGPVTVGSGPTRSNKATAVRGRAVGSRAVPPKSRRVAAKATPAPRGGGIDLGKFAGEVGRNLDGLLKSRGASGIVPHTMKNLPKGGVMGVVDKATRR